MKKTCAICGKVFSAKFTRPDIKCCSFACAGKWRSENLVKEKSSNWNGGEKNKTCEICGKTYSVKLFRFLTQRYCSIKCHSISRKIKTLRLCRFCGKEFTPPHGGKESQKYCSRSCYIKSAIGKNAANWRGGLSFEPYPIVFNKQFKEKIRKRDNYTCAICGEFGKAVHHINYIKNDTFPENCITLCQSCHVKTNGNREYWIEYFTTKASD